MAMYLQDTTWRQGVWPQAERAMQGSCWCGVEDGLAHGHIFGQGTRLWHGQVVLPQALNV
jgi:hypothetical protein